MADVVDEGGGGDDNKSHVHSSSSRSSIIQIDTSHTTHTLLQQQHYNTAIDIDTNNDNIDDDNDIHIINSLYTDRHSNINNNNSRSGGKLSPLLRSLSRSPRPYRRTQTPQEDPKPPGIRRWSLDEMRAEGSGEGRRLLLTTGDAAMSRSGSPTTPLSPSPSPTPWGSESVRWAFRNQSNGGLGSESGTEADDELPKKLPAPPRRHGKGLRGAIEEEDIGDEEDDEGDASGTVDDRTRKGKGRQESSKGKASRAGGDGVGISGGVRQGEEDFGASVRPKRRKNVAFVRRAVEVSLIAGLMGVVFMGRRRGKVENGVPTGNMRIWREVLGRWRTEAAAWTLAYAGVLLAYPFAIVLRRVVTAVSNSNDYSTTASLESDTDQIDIRKFIQLPRSIDPAPLLYPVFFPIAVSLLISPDVVLQNLIMSLASLPPKLFPHFYFHWGVSLLPLLAQSSFPTLKTIPPGRQAAEVLSYLPALHIYLTEVLSWTLQPSLTMTEIRLLSTGLVNLYISSTTPQAIILKALLWIGGFGVLLGCSDLITWGVQLARIPRHRFRRAGEVVRDLGRFAKFGGRRRRGGKYGGYASTSASGEDPLDNSMPHPQHPHGGDDDGSGGGYFSSKSGKKSLEALAAAAGRSGGVKSAGGTIEFKIIDGGKNRFPVSIVLSPATTTTAPPPPPAQPVVASSSSSSSQPPLAPQSPTTSLHPPPATATKRKRAHSTSLSWYTSLTHSQARTRKYLYAALVYIIILLLIFLGIRPYLTEEAFDGTDPFPWAASYLFCGVPGYSNFTSAISGFLNHPYPPGEGWTGCSVWYNSQWSISFPTTTTPTSTNSTLPLLDPHNPAAPAEANKRLYITFYWLLILLAGLSTIHLLSPHRFEVDTRRKLFHGMVVLMFLFVGVLDPYFTHLSMSLVLSIFMIADLIRAGQLPPVSRPLSEFLAPFVDGRDLKGPVVVSHFFLLVGGAVAVWFTIAKEAVGGVDVGGALASSVAASLRRTEFVAGVVCVGLGDSAASLVGRRWGTRKWGWHGGKSVQGSLAFMAAVSAGLGVARWWLGVLEGGGGGGGSGGSEGGGGAVAAFLKIVGAAGGAAMLEAVVTGGNDNVVVPIALWCCVVALGL
ncbi:hypothetical protein DFH27DRAFT_614294 [Peziza echinospora]|nr:hypothetical protein DFH27DRAFT_614294 [Peziza echinospora]